MGFIWFALGWASGIACCIGLQLYIAQRLAAGPNSKMPVKETITVAKGH